MKAGSLYDVIGELFVLTGTGQQVCVGSWASLTSYLSSGLFYYAQSRRNWESDTVQEVRD